jgi:hypothetical protein
MEAVGLISHAASAQVNTDVGANTGLGIRLRTGTPKPVAAIAGIDVRGHVALVPLVRVGVYAGLEGTLPNGSEDRLYYAFGLDAKVASPWTPAPWHTWAFVGVGAAYVVATRHAVAGSSDTGGSGMQSSQADGALVELPVGVGAGIRVHSTWAIDAVLSARPAIASFGPESRPSPGPDTQPFAGHELLAVWLTVGVSFCR